MNYSDPGEYRSIVETCLDTLIERGRDRYGSRKTPQLVSIIDTETLTCPKCPEKLDEDHRVHRRGRRNPAGANLECDQAVLRSMYSVSNATGEAKYGEFARQYASHVMDTLIDEKGFFWWGWHRRYDVYDDERNGHGGAPHELHAIHEIDWEHLWEIDPAVVRREIEAIWKWHVVDKETGEINRHGDGQSGCDFSMSAGAFIEAFAFLYGETGEEAWLDRARLLADYYWERRNPQTDLFPERPNAAGQRFDGSSFVTAITGLHCWSLLKAWRLTGVEQFRDYAVSYLKAYGEYGYDEEAGKFWGALNLDGTPITGPRTPDGYDAHHPVGYLDLWQPYVAGYEYPIYTAQTYAYAYQLTGDAELLRTATRFAEWIATTPTDTFEHPETAPYRDYCHGAGNRGTYAGKYGRTVSFFLNLYSVTDNEEYLATARETADAAIDKLWHEHGLFSGHPAKPYYETIDGVGYLLNALLQLDRTIENPREMAATTGTAVGDPGPMFGNR